jgi:hypothetical protein
LAALFSVTVFLSASLLFVVQPMVGKMLLPLLGGVPAVWNTCLVFFQSALLVGYSYAHAATARLEGRSQVVLHVALALLALGTLLVPVRLDPAGFFSATEEPIPWLLLQLALAVGLPIVVLSATTPMLQRWFAPTHDGPSRDPYFLYAGSNLGSLAALLSYPLLLEPHLSLGLQSRLWTRGYVGLVGLVAACGLYSAWVRKADPARSAPAHSARAGWRDQVERIDARRRVRWTLLAFVPSSYLLGVTAFLSTDVAAVPLLWVLPLALYLLSFILVFAPMPLVRHRRFARLLPALILFAVLVNVSGMTLSLWLLIPLHLSAFFAAAVMCHGELAVDRPAPSALTEYYLLMSLGGALGGALTALVAPVLFDRIVEYPLAMVLSCLLRPAEPGHARERKAAPGWARRLDVALPLALGGFTAGLVLGVPWLGLVTEHARVAAMFGLPAIVCYTFVARPTRFALGLIALLLAAQLYAGPQGRPLLEARTFFGVLRVTVDAGGRFHQLVHGNTIHGRQRRSGTLRDEPLSYYHPSGPAGDVFGRFREAMAPGAFAIVGLGAGSLCAYARQGEEWVFYEIDPAVERIARDPTYFTFWRDCRAELRSVVRGDARLRLAESADGRYGMLVVDAFSSDAIPVHLITQEALELYRRKTAASGWIVFHISSQHLDLRPVIGSLAGDAGWVAYARDDLLLAPEEREAGKDPSQWVVMAKTRSRLGALAEDPRWFALPVQAGARVWTDDFSNLWSAIKWE